MWKWLLGSRLRSLLALLVLGALALALLFVWNGRNAGWRDGESGRTAHPVRTDRDGLVVMAWNLAKSGFHRGGADFASVDEVEGHLDAVAGVVRAEEVDLLFLSEVVHEAFPNDVDQVAYLAEAAGFAYWCYGDNYSYGIPGARIRSGNALLSRYPLDEVEVHAFAGGGALLDPTGVRRVLVATADLAGAPLRCASLRNDSFDPANNAVHAAEVLELVGEGPALLAGDFNAVPGSESMELLRASKRFRGGFEGPPTFPADRPHRRIDSILVPAGWVGGLRPRVLAVDLSDHEPVLVEVPEDPLPGPESGPGR